MRRAALRRRFKTNVEIFLNQSNVIGRLMIALLFVGGVVYAGAFDGFVVETEASSCCGGGTDATLFSSSECCDEQCTCGCYIAGCSDCEIISSCGGGCNCKSNPPGPSGILDACFAHCSTANSNKNVCENNCGY